MHIIVLPLVLLLTTFMLQGGTIIVSGKALVIDGDTIDINDNRIRLHGIDAPESGQLCNNKIGKPYNCGQVATLRLSALIGSNEVWCDVKDKDRYDRLVAVCFARQRNLNEQLVYEGLALAYRKYSKDFVDAEIRAKQDALGFWGGEFIAPWKWRRGERLTTAENSEVDPNNCVIKGNISNNGKIYHTPESPWYGRTKIDESKGERWFCSVVEAELDGWRAVNK